MYIIACKEKIHCVLNFIRSVPYYCFDVAKLGKWVSSYLIWTVSQSFLTQSVSTDENEQMNIYPQSRGTVVSGVNTRLVLTRMRKVVGSNPSDAEFDHRFSFVELIWKKETDSRTNWNDNKCNEAKELFESIFFEWPYHLIKNINVNIVSWLFPPNN